MPVVMEAEVSTRLMMLFEKRSLAKDRLTSVMSLISSEVQKKVVDGDKLSKLLIHFEKRLKTLDSIQEKIEFELDPVELDVEVEKEFLFRQTAMDVKIRARKKQCELKKKEDDVEVSSLADSLSQKSVDLLQFYELPVRFGLYWLSECLEPVVECQPKEATHIQRVRFKLPTEEFGDDSPRWGEGDSLPKQDRGLSVADPGVVPRVDLGLAVEADPGVVPRVDLGFAKEADSCVVGHGQDSGLKCSSDADPFVVDPGQDQSLKHVDADPRVTVPGEERSLSDLGDAAGVLFSVAKWESRAAGALYLFILLLMLRGLSQGKLMECESFDQWKMDFDQLQKMVEQDFVDSKDLKEALYLRGRCCKFKSVSSSVLVLLLVQFGVCMCC